MAAAKSSLLDIEKQRLLLEENIAKLRRALQHWRQWDAEYEALKEEIELIPKPTSQKELARIRRDHVGELIDKKEISDIFGRIDLKPTDQIISLLSRRIDYVTRNIETLEKQIEDAESKYADAAVAISPDGLDEEGLPITEIVEELDDDDNVLSYRLRKPGEAQPQLQEILEKVGVKDLTEPDQKSEAALPAVQEAIQPQSTVALRQAQPSKSEPQDKTDGGSASATRSVSFAEDTKPGHEPPTSRAARRVEQVMQAAKEQEESSQQAAVVPVDESEEDALLRRQMLEYGMGEVGAVVAELTLEEGTDDDDDWDLDHSDEDDDEDEFGRSKTFLDDGYHQRMLELEKRLGVKSRFTQKLETEDELSDVGNEGIGRIIVKNDTQPSPTAAINQPAAPKSSSMRSGDATSNVRSVRFADSLDVAPEAPEPDPASTTKAPKIDPVGDVVERTGQTKRPEQTSTRKPSRFRKQLVDPATSNDTNPKAPATSIPKGPLDVPVRFMNQDRPTAPTGPEGQTVADAVVEHSTTAALEEPEEFDDEFVDQEVAEEYHRRRKNFIHREGGFMKEDESPIQPLDEDEGGPKRMSRFKAARLSKQ